MELMTYTIDSANSKFTIRTRATGMLARLAHDLEFVAADIRGQAVRNDEGISGEIVVPVSGLRVVGQLHGDRLDPAGISPSDRLDIERKVREEVFQGAKEIHVRGRGTAWNHVDVTIVTTHGEMGIPISFRGSEVDGRVRISGRTEVSLSKLGVREIKGPLGAFKVKDAVEVLFDVILQPAS